MVLLFSYVHPAECKETTYSTGLGHIINMIRNHVYYVCKPFAVKSDSAPATNKISACLHVLYKVQENRENVL